MFDVILVNPEIPPNTGNVIRLCANTGSRLHLVEPLGFELSAARLRRAGLDYAEMTSIRIHADWAQCLAALRATSPRGRHYALTTKGECRVADAAFQVGDALIFGCETRGLPPDVFDTFPSEQRLRLPMVPNSRSINLSNAVAVTVYEAWRQIGYSGAL